MSSCNNKKKTTFGLLIKHICRPFATFVVIINHVSSYRKVNTRGMEILLKGNKKIWSPPFEQPSATTRKIIKMVIRLRYYNFSVKQSTNKRLIKKYDSILIAHTFIRLSIRKNPPLRLSV